MKDIKSALFTIVFVAGSFAVAASQQPPAATEAQVAETGFCEDCQTSQTISAQDLLKTVKIEPEKRNEREDAFFADPNRRTSLEKMAATDSPNVLKKISGGLTFQLDSSSGITIGKSRRQLLNYKKVW